MLRIVQSSSSAGAKRYFASADYYSEGQELAGEWKGRGAALLGLAGPVTREAWERLCDNLHPATGEPLTVRRKAERRVGYDFNFHVPKSVSVLFGLSRDERIAAALNDSVGETMRDIEQEVQTRVRGGGRDADRTTSNAVWGQYLHFTARPVGGVPDPHLHVHAFLFNATYDAEERRWKAAQLGNIKRDARYFEAMFHSRLARKMEELGLPVERTRRGWELAGVSPATVRAFSRRTALIEDVAKAEGIVDPTAKGELGALTRERKAGSLSMPELQALWHSRLDPDEAATFDALASKVGSGALPEDPASAALAARHAIGHCFEQSAVVPERVLLAEALRRGVGRSSHGTVHDAVRAEGLITRDLDGRRMVTSREVLREEQAMLEFARSGRGTRTPLGPDRYTFRRDWLSDEQRAAVRHVLSSTDAVILVRGAAGTGKTTMMQEAADGIRAGGKDIFVFAPSSAASHGVLKQDAGFEHADTVAALLVNPPLQEKTRGNVIWIDEAGLLGSRVTKQVFDIAERMSARVVLAGDKRQHSSVERGGTLRLLEEEAGLIPAELRQVRRQSGEYRQAVTALSEGKVGEGLRRLADMGWLRELGEGERYRQLAEAYLESRREPGETLVISPTHAEAAKITVEIRGRLHESGRLGKSREFTKLRPLAMTEAERRDSVNYEPGDVLVFHKHAPGHPKGVRLSVGHARDAARTLPLEHADRFTVYRPEAIRLAVGDRIRITRNRVPTKESPPGEKRLNNGDIFTITGFAPDGAIGLSNGAALPGNWGHLDYGYVVTSHSAQGKSVDRVIIGQSADSYPATSREQLYVSISRGKKQAVIFTDDRKALLDAASKGDGRMTATELVTARHPAHPSKRDADHHRPRERQRTAEPAEEQVHER